MLRIRACKIVFQQYRPISEIAGFANASSSAGKGFAPFHLVANTSQIGRPTDLSGWRRIKMLPEDVF